MKRLMLPIVAVAVLTAACGGAAALSASKDKPITVAAAVQVNGGANAGADTSDIVSRPNQPIHKGGTAQVSQATPKNAAPAGPQTGTTMDRCGSGIGTIGAGNRASTTGQPTHQPLPMCAVE